MSAPSRTLCTWVCVYPAPSQAHCPGCHRTFASVKGFDVHRRRGECLNPAVDASLLGYQREDGVWLVSSIDDEMASAR